MSQSANLTSQDNNISLYVGVDHNMNHAIKGGAFAVFAVHGPLSDPRQPPRPNEEPIGTYSNKQCVCSPERMRRPPRAVANATK
jgi:hypothetical protein